mmetsp:Transcript_17702/g.44596  ORF Transcript_17702/g.44596 Transcript_17702/m.44596 type:complete len:235 (+) Transcript_17702:552-1256(+)
MRDATTWAAPGKPGAQWTRTSPPRSAGRRPPTPSPTLGPGGSGGTGGTAARPSQCPSRRASSPPGPRQWCGPSGGAPASSLTTLGLAGWGGTCTSRRAPASRGGGAGCCPTTGAPPREGAGNRWGSPKWATRTGTSALGNPQASSSPPQRRRRWGVSATCPLRLSPSPSRGSTTRSPSTRSARTRGPSPRSRRGAPSRGTSAAASRTGTRLASGPASTGGPTGTRATRRTSPCG